MFGNKPSATNNKFGQAAIFRYRTNAHANGAFNLVMRLTVVGKYANIWGKWIEKNEANAANILAHTCAKSL